MKSTLNWVIALSLFAALASPVLLSAQENQITHFRHYKLIDLGTFGGPSSYINAPFAQGAFNQVNNQGTAVGAAATTRPIPPPPPNKQICGGVDGIVPFIFHAFAFQNRRLTDLGALGDSPDMECSEAVSINAKGEIAGRSENGVIDPVALEGGLSVEEVRAVIWKNGKIENLGTLGGNHSIAAAINNRGQVVGYTQNTTPDPFSLLYLLAGGLSNGTQTRGFLWHNGRMRDLGTLGGPDAQAFALNERGQAVGTSYINTTPNPITGVPTADPFLWSEEGGMVDLGTLGGGSGIAGALNNQGQVIGVSSVAADPGACVNTGGAATATCHPFFWEQGSLTDLNTDTIGGSPITANALSDAGVIIGAAAFTDAPYQAYRWRHGVARNLGAVDSDCFSEAFVINSRDQIAGISIPCAVDSLRAFLWENGAMVDLNAVSSPNSLHLIDVDSINDRGEIGGVGVPAGCSEFSDDACGHAFLLIPVCSDGSEGCAYAPLDPTVVSHSRAASGAMPQMLAPDDLAKFREQILRIHSRMASRNRSFGLGLRR